MIEKLTTDEYGVLVSVLQDESFGRYSKAELCKIVEANRDDYDPGEVNSLLQKIQTLSEEEVPTLLQEAETAYGEWLDE